jgi:RNA polymerase sigma-70 factor (ECF subfamily)
MATAKRDARAFEQLYAGSCAKVYGVVLRILRRHDMAADVMEESYAQIWQDAELFNPPWAMPSRRSPTPRAPVRCHGVR